MRSMGSCSLGWRKALATVAALSSPNLPLFLEPLLGFLGKEIMVFFFWEGGGGESEREGAEECFGGMQDAGKTSDRGEAAPRHHDENSADTRKGTSRGKMRAKPPKDHISPFCST